MKVRHVLLASLFPALASCSKNKGKKSGSDNIDLESALENAESRGKADPTASGVNKYLLDYQSKYDRLWSEEKVVTTTGFYKDVMTIKNNTV